MPDLAVDPRLGLVSPGVAAARRPDRAARHRRPAARAASRHPERRPVGLGRPRRGGRRAAQRQEHAAALDRHQHGADLDAAGDAVLRPRLRRRHLRAAGRPAARGRRRDPVRAGRGQPDRGRGAGHRRPPRGVLPAAWASTRSRPTGCAAAGPRTRVGPTTGTATCSSSSTAGARCARTSTTSRSTIQQLSTRGLTFGLHIVSAASRWAGLPGRHARPCSAPGSSCGSATRWTPRSTAASPRWCPPVGPGRGLVGSKLHFLGALPRIDGTATAGDLGDGVDDLVAKVRAAWTGPEGPKLRLLPDADRPRRGARAGRRARRTRSCWASTSGTWPRSASTRTSSRTCWCSATAAPARAACCGRWPRRSSAPGPRTRRRSCVVDYRRALLGEVPDEYLLNYVTSAAQATPALARDRGLPPEPHPRPRRHPGAAARAVVVVGGRPLRARRRLRPGRHAAELAGRGAPAAARPGTRRRAPPHGRPSVGWCVTRALRAGDPDPA